MLDESIVILGVSSLFCSFYTIFDENPVCKQCTYVGPDQTPHYVVSDQGLHYVSMNFLQVSR